MPHISRTPCLGGMIKLDAETSRRRFTLEFKCLGDDDLYLPGPPDDVINLQDLLLLIQQAQSAP
jgi:hypothetical protein